MIMQTGVLLSTGTVSGNKHESFARSAAIKQFTIAYTQGWFHNAWAALTHRPARLCNLKDIESTASIYNRHYKGIQTVPIEQIRGTENRSADFDDQFHPIQKHNEERWINVATAMQQGKGLPPVELIKVGDTYFVRDGHHRISVARALGQKDIDAAVTTWDVN